MARSQVTIGPVVCEVNVEATIAAYERIPAEPMGGCNCGDCKNFAAQADVLLRGRFFDWLQTLGVDRIKPNEIVSIGDSSEPVRLHWLYYGVVGVIVPDAQVAESDDHLLHSLAPVNQLGVACSLGESDPLVMGDAFENPYFGIEVSLPDVPWVLDSPMDHG